MAKEVKNPTNFRLTEGEDGIWLHFESKRTGKKAGISLESLCDHGNIVNSTVREWAKEQLEGA